MAVWVNDLRKMRERNLLYLFLALNVGLAGAFIAYLFLSNSRQPEIVPSSFPTLSKTNALTNVAAVTRARPEGSKTNVAVTAIAAADLKAGVVPETNQIELKPVFTRKKFTWEQVESDEYVKYVNSLRAVGCPEEKIRYIILADINELCAKHRASRCPSSFATLSVCAWRGSQGRQNLNC